MSGPWHSPRAWWGRRAQRGRGRYDRRNMQTVTTFFDMIPLLPPAKNAFARTRTQLHLADFGRTLTLRDIFCGMVWYLWCGASDGCRRPPATRAKERERCVGARVCIKHRQWREFVDR